MLKKNIKTKYNKELDSFEKQLAKFDEHQKVEFETKLYEELISLVVRKSKELKNKFRLEKIDAEKNNEPANQILTKDQISLLPRWVANELDNSAIIGNSRKLVQTPDKRKYHLDNKLNDLSGGEWTFFLNSVITSRYPTSGAESYAHDIRKIHPSPKPPQLMKEIIEFFTKEDALVFDYFMGVGGTLLGASLCNRRAIGVDLSSKYISAYKSATKALGLQEQKVVQADSVKLLQDAETTAKLFGGEMIDLILVDPPYGDMMAREKTGEAAKKKKSTEATPFTILDEDLGNMQWDMFRDVFSGTVENALKHLKHKGHLAIFIKDLQPKAGATNLLHADLINDINSLDDISYLGTKIWADLSVNLYPYGYPHSYVSNQIHQYIMIFRKG